MKFQKLVILLIVLWLTQSALGGCAPAKVPELPGWTLIWNDEFNGRAGKIPDSTQWGYDLGGGGWGNGELEYYTDKAGNASTNGKGQLVITADKVNPSETDLSCWYGACQYTSARLLTKDKFSFTYGRAEARIKVPYGQGIWPAFWMLGEDIDTNPWPNCGEIDIMEIIGKDPSIVHGTVHGPGYSGTNGFGGSFTLSSGAFNDDFHIFAIEWEPNEIRWTIDGQQYFSATPEQVNGDWVYNHPFFLVLNLAVGGNWPGLPNDSTVFPQTLQVDYVRIYQKQG